MLASSPSDKPCTVLIDGFQLSEGLLELSGGKDAITLTAYQTSGASPSSIKYSKLLVEFLCHVSNQLAKLSPSVGGSTALCPVD